MPQASTGGPRHLEAAASRSARARNPEASRSARAGSPEAVAPRRAGLRPPAPSAKRPGGKRTSTPTPQPSAQTRELALTLATEGIEKKALGIEILDVTGKLDYADFLVIMTGRSDRHVQAIASGIEEAMRRKKVVPLSIEGLQNATWVLMDFGDVVVHVFQEDARRLYDIEGLWIDAGRVPVPVGAEDPTGFTSPDDRG
jgi:ribosome-associated protein